MSLVDESRTLNESVVDKAARMLFVPKRSTFILEVVGVLAGIVLAWVGALVLLEDEPPGFEPASIGVTLALLIPATVLLLARRRFPVAVLAVSTVLLVIVRIEKVPEFQVSSISFVIAFYAAGRWGSAGWRDAVRVFAVLAIVSLIARELLTTADEAALFGITRRTFYLTGAVNSAWNVLMFAVTWWAGDLGRKRTERERELAARTLELEASQDENARRAVMDERVRIAREIHDVVAHHVSVMGVQAGAARRIVDIDPGATKEPLRAIESSSREAVTELHRLLGFLRRADEPDPDGLSADALAPTPGLSRLPELRSQLANAGMALKLSIAGTERPLAPSLDLNAYRILQEALTNCLKYAGVDVAEVSITYGDDALHLAVSDRGRGPATDAPAGAKRSTTGGAGLVGMAERVALLGGSLRHGARDGGGFEVAASLPYAGSVTAAPSMVPQADGTSVVEGVSS